MADDMHDLTMNGRLAACHDAWRGERHEAKVKCSLRQSEMTLELYACGCGSLKQE